MCPPFFQRSHQYCLQPDWLFLVAGDSQRLHSDAPLKQTVQGEKQSLELKGCTISNGHVVSLRHNKQANLHPF